MGPGLESLFGCFVIDTQESHRRDIGCLESKLESECTTAELAVHKSECHLVMTNKEMQ